MISLVDVSKTGLIMVMSGKWLSGNGERPTFEFRTDVSKIKEATYDPPACGELVMSTSPGFKLPLCNFI